MRRADPTPADRTGAGRRDAVVVAGLVLLTLLTAWRALGWPMISQDETFLLLYPDQVGRGQVPNVDFNTIYGAPSYWFLLVVYKLFGLTVTVERVVGLGYHIVLVLGLYAATRRHGTAPAVLGGLIAVALLLPQGAVPFAWLGGLALVVWGLVLAGAHDDRRAWVVGGVLLGLATGWRYELALAGALGVLPLVVRHPRFRYVVAGGLAGFVPTAIHLGMAWSSVYDNVIGGRITGNFRLDPSFVPGYVKIGVGLTALMVLGLFYRAWRSRDRRDLAWALACVGLMPQAMQRIDDTHLCYTAVAVIPLFVAGWLSEPVSRGLRGFDLKVPLPLLIALVLPFIISVQHIAHVHARPLATVSVGDRSIELPVKVADDFNELLTSVKQLVPPGADIFIGTDDMGQFSLNAMPLYFLLNERNPAKSYYLELAPGVAERDGSGLAEDIKRADLLILSKSSPQEWKLYAYLPRGFQENNRTVQENFCAVVDAESYALYLPLAEAERQGRRCITNGSTAAAP